MSLLLNKLDLTSEEKFDLLVLNVPYDKSTTTPQLEPQETSTFLIDKGAAGVDWLHTTNGSWWVKKTRYRLFQLNKSNEWNSTEIKLDQVPGIKDADSYIMKSSYSHHSNVKYKNVKRYVTEMLRIQVGNEDKPSKAESTTYGLVQYVFPTPNIILSPKKRQGVAFPSMAPSTKTKIKEAVKTSKGPRTLFSELTGDLLQHTVPGTVPRNINHQIDYFRRKENKASRFGDDLDEIMIYATKDDVGKNCIQNLQIGHKGIRFTLAMDPQIDDIIDTCTTLAVPCGILCIDTTYNVGNFFMTPTCYSLPTVINKRTNKPVILPGPCLFHVQEESKDVYLYFAHCLVEMNTEIERIRFIGGDRGRGQKGFLHPFRSVTMMPCTRHIQNNLKEQISDSNVQSRIFGDLFGKKDGINTGLVYSNLSSFDDKISKLYETWPDNFSRYFQTHVEADFKEGMLQDVREAVGFGDELFYNNGLECLNKKIKSKKREMQSSVGCGPPVSKPCTLFEAVKIYMDLIFEERRFIHEAMIGKGPYRLADSCKHMFVDESTFCKLNPEEKRKALAKLDRFMKKGFEFFNSSAFLRKSSNASSK